MPELFSSLHRYITAFFLSLTFKTKLYTKIKEHIELPIIKPLRLFPQRPFPPMEIL